MVEIRQRIDRNECGMDTEGRGEGSQTATQCQSRGKKINMMNIYLTDSDDEAIVDLQAAATSQ